MTLLLVRKLLRDLRWPLLVVSVILFVFSMLWVKIAQRVTTEVAPFFNGIAELAKINPKLMDEVIFKGPGRVSQAVMGGGEIRFEIPSHFLAVEMMHPVVLFLAGMWAIGRAAGAVSGEIDRGTMELLMSQPVPRGRLILAHFLVDLIVIPVFCLSIVAGTQAGLELAGPFTVDYTMLDKLTENAPIKFRPAAGPPVLEVQAGRQIWGALNLAALIFAFSGLTMLISAAGRNRWRTTGWAALIFVVMFVVNVLGQLWDSAAGFRPATLFFYYQPQKVWLTHEWTANLAEAWGGTEAVPVPVIPLLLAVGGAGYALAYRIFTRRDLPAPL